MSKSKVLHIVGGMNIGGTETMLMNLYREVNNDIQFDFVFQSSCLINKTIYFHRFYSIF